MKRKKLNSVDSAPNDSPIKQKSPAEKPVSLNPLSVEEALKNLLKTKPLSGQDTSKE